MSEKRFIVETVEIIDCDTDESRIAKVITDTNELYSYDDLYELCDDLNKLAEENEELRQELEENKSIINFCSNGEDEDLHKLIKENEQLQQQVTDLKDYLYEAERDRLWYRATGDEEEELEIAYNGSVEDFLDFFRSDSDE